MELDLPQEGKHQQVHRHYGGGNNPRGVPKVLLMPNGSYDPLWRRHHRPNSRHQYARLAIQLPRNARAIRNTAQATFHINTRPRIPAGRVPVAPPGRRSRQKITRGNAAGAKGAPRRGLHGPCCGGLVERAFERAVEGRCGGAVGAHLLLLLLLLGGVWRLLLLRTFPHWLQNAPGGVKGCPNGKLMRNCRALHLLRGFS